MITLVLGNITEVDAFAKVYFENSALMKSPPPEPKPGKREGLELYIECPVWKGGINNEQELLNANYRSSLQIAKEENCQSIAFYYNCLGKEAIPDELACKYAINTVSKYLFDENLAIEVLFVCPYQFHFDLYESLLLKKIVKRSFKITGMVQGVFYRQSTYQKAQELSLSGFVQNKKDGSVYIEVQGSLYHIHLLFDWCLEGPPMSMVENIKVEELKTLSDKNLFSIKR